jgi:MHS family shikimate/dehydroshikimate transporter-like MFS transporter
VITTTTSDQPEYTADRIKESRRVALASLVGTAIEWYDFFIYGTAAALVFNVQFFPDLDPLAGTLAAFATFGVGFAARPLGGLIFGHFGDRIGRKPMLVTTLLIMGIATVLVGLLPTYQAIGIWAPILLVVVRLAQGLAVGGEWGGAVLLAVETAPKGKRGYYGAWPQVGLAIGLLTSTGAFAAFSAMDNEAFMAWGWRVPFLLSVVLIVVGLVIRLRLEESRAFTAVREKVQRSRHVPIKEVLRHYKKSVLLGLGSRLVLDITFYIFTVFSLTYITRQLGLPQSVALTGVLIAAVIELVTIPFFGALSDRIGRRTVYMFGAVFLTLFSYPFFLLLDTAVPWLVVSSIVIGVSIGHAATYGSQAALFAELFDTRVRYTGASLTYQTSGIIGGGPAPFIALFLLGVGEGSPLWVIVYMIGVGLLGVVCTYFLEETYKRDFNEARVPTVTPTQRTEAGANAGSAS